MVSVERMECTKAISKCRQSSITSHFSTDSFSSSVQCVWMRIWCAIVSNSLPHTRVRTALSIRHLPFLVMTFAAPDAKKILDAKMGVYLVNFTTTESYAYNPAILAKRHEVHQFPLLGYFACNNIPYNCKFHF